MNLARKQREFESREQDILNTALELFSSPSWESVSVEQIALKAGVAKGTVYSHFSSKDEILFHLYIDFYRGLLTDLMAMVGSDDIVAEFRKVIERALNYHTQHNEYRYIVSHCKRVDCKERADDELKAVFHELDNAFSHWGCDLIQVGMDAGVFEIRSAEQVMLGLHACFDGTINMLWAGKHWCVHSDPETIMESATDFMLAGVVGRK